MQTQQVISGHQQGSHGEDGELSHPHAGIGRRVAPGGAVEEKHATDGKWPPESNWTRRSIDQSGGFPRTRGHALHSA